VSAPGAEGITELNIIIIGAHPDDCEYRCAGTAAKWAAGGHAVKFVSMTRGDAGHHEAQSEPLAARRKTESEEAARRLGIAAVENLPHHDGLLEPSLEAREKVIRLIRQWRADVVVTHRPNDYHPDHRYTSQLVQDSAYLVLVPLVCPDTPPLRRNPVYLYMEDEFRKPYPFQPDCAVSIDDVWSKKIASLDAHVSQFYEWLPWVDGRLDQVPGEAGARRAWLDRQMRRVLPPAVASALVRRYGAEAAAPLQHAEAYELCEYGRQPSPEELERLLPR
jgi:LmbE family N-acetylglucosaminyl deacetylase